MNTHAEKTKHSDGQSKPPLNEQATSELQSQYIDSRSEAHTNQKLQGVADQSARVKQLRSIQKMADTSGQKASTETPNSTGLPDDLKSGIENLSGLSMDDVRVHRNSSKPAGLQAHAYAQGSEIHLAPGQDKHLPHEAWHVVQQKQGRVKPTTQLMGKTNINDDVALEREADIMGTRARRFAGKTDGKSGNPPPPVQQRVVQRVTYAELADPQAKAKVDQWSEEAYSNKTLDFELGMARKIMTNDAANSIVNIVLSRVNTIVTAWAESTGKTLADAYGREFVYARADKYYGAFPMTADNVGAVFRDHSKPMRTKLKVIYNAVRNNNLAKWLKVAAIEIDRAARGERARAQKIKTAAQNVLEADPRNRDRRRIVTGVARKELVQPGFAEESGISSWMSAARANEIATVATREKMTERKRFGSSNRDVFGHDKSSSLLNWHTDTAIANNDRRDNASGGLAIADQRTLKSGDVADLTDEEIDQIYINKENRQSSVAEKAAYRADPQTKLDWEQGGEYYDVNLHSDTAKAAEGVKARLEAGISGSTDLMMHAIQNLGLDDPVFKKGLRLALAGWMMANRDHSFYEVYKAAESYGVPFHRDANNPGIEYETAENLYPMGRADFADTLPSNHFPRYFLSVAYKDICANNLGVFDATQATYKDWLRGFNVSEKTVEALDERGNAEVQRLRSIVLNNPVLNDADAAKRSQAVRRVKDSSTFRYLASKLPQGEAEAILTALIQSQHPGTAAMLTPQDRFEAIAGAGVPRGALRTLTAIQLGEIESLIKCISSATKTPAGQIANMTPINQAVQASTVPAALIGQIRDAVIYKHHGIESAVAAEAANAKELKHIADIENVARMELTSGWWYSWGTPILLQGFLQGSIRQTAFAAGFEWGPQGQGLYVASDPALSEDYGQNPGSIVLAVKMSGVPTINHRNAGQLRLLHARGVIPNPHIRELYKKYNRVEILMRYMFSGGWARLTTNVGIADRTLDLSKIGATQLRTEYDKLTNARTKANFKAQATQCGIDTSAWP